MLTWFPITVAAYACLAFSQVLDKVFLVRFFRDSRAYAVFVGAIGVLAFFALPFTGSLPSLSLWFWSLLGGAVFIFALLPFLDALQSDDATRVIPLTGAGVPVLTLLLERLFLDVPLPTFAYPALACLIIGSTVLTYSRSTHSRRSRLAMMQALGASTLFASSFVMSKHVYLQMDFITGFVWMRIGGLIAALIIVIASRSVQQEISRLARSTRIRVFAAYVGNQGIAGLGFVLQNLAIALVSASVVTAMQGVQYIFILFFIVLFSRFRPSLVQERITKALILEKLTATACIIVGLALLAL